MKRLLIVTIAVAFVVGILGLSQAKAKPPTTETWVESVTYAAGEPWLDALWYENVCDFEVRIDYDEKVVTHELHNGDVILKITLRDTYTNVDTGFSFVDFASYTIRVDHETGYAIHQGNFWRIVVLGTGVILKDMGQFVQDWNDPYGPIFPESLKGANHDGNGPFAETGELPGFTYGMLLDGYLPE